MHKDRLLKIKDGECFYWCHPDYGPIAEIWRMNDIYFLFQIPAFEPEKRIFDSPWSMDDIDLLEKTILEWN